MPTVRSPTSSRRDDSETTTTDWSLNTPTETSSATATSATTRKTAPSTSSVRTRAATAAAASQDTRTPAPRNIGGSEEAPPCVPTVPAAKASRDIGGRTAPPCVPAAQRARSTKSRSVRSSKSRMAELEARRKLEIAKSAAALAEIELEMVQCQSEEEIDDEDIDREVQSTHIEQWINQSATIMEKQDCEKTQEAYVKVSDIEKIADKMVTAVQASTRAVIPAAPSKYAELPSFNGASEDWLPFLRTYRDSVAQFSDTQNMARLRHSIHGTAKESVRQMLFTAHDPDEVIATLERRYGNPERLVLAELAAIQKLPHIGESCDEICAFASRVSNAVATISALRKPEYLCSPQVSRDIVQKLSPSLRIRWFDYVKAHTEDPVLVNLRKFLENEADLWATFAPVEAPAKRFNRRVHTARTEENRGQQTISSGKKYCANCESREHWITECKQFRESTTEDRWAIVKNKKLCFMCLRQKHSKNTCKGPSCRKCGRQHHIMLHAGRQAAQAPPEKPAPRPQPQPQTQTQGESEEATIKTVYAAADGKEVYLKMIPVDVFGPAGSARVLALLDEGSTVSLLDNAVAQEIGASGKEDLLILETVGGKLVERKDSQIIDIKIKGAHRRDKRLLRGVRTVTNLKLSPQHVSIETINKCAHLKNRSELVYSKERPALLIGQDNWEMIVSRKIIKGKSNQPVASLTSLGWVLHGCCATSDSTPVKFVNHVNNVSEEADIEKLIKSHFELESIGVQQRRPTNDADGRALDILHNTTKRRPDGRFESGLLWKSDEETLPNNYAMARHRLNGIEKKLEKDAALKGEYTKQIQNLLDSGYAEKAPTEATPGRTFYLPHFAVVHPQKRKTRLVFDAAAKYDGKCLNDALLPGPDLLQSLFGVLLRFRQGPIAVVADIKEMFLQIRVREEDRDSLRFLWRGDDRSSEPTEYRMASVIFGAASSPATAIYVKNRNAEDFKATHPEAAQAIVRNHYMDDYLQSFTSSTQAIETAKAVQVIHRKAGFELRQWASNDAQLLSNLAENETSPQEIHIGDNEEKTLGLRWLVGEDCLAFNNNLRNTPSDVIQNQRAPTKREVTSAVMSTFDPLGLVAPILIQGKRLIQTLWRTGTDWDESIGEEAHHQWRDYINSLSTLRDMKIPRCFTPSMGAGQLHTFVDASETAYAAACYWRSIGNGVCVTLIAGKARVAPVKPVTIPRLELQAALLGARLANTITEELELKTTDKFYWSDSSTVLQWMKADPRRFKPFVAHRLAAIEEISKPHEWRWVPTRENPADIATRGVPNGFSEDSKWFVGPDFLHRPETDWPQKRLGKCDQVLDEEKKSATVLTTRTRNDDTLPSPERFSSWIKLLRTMARIFQFTELCRKGRVVNVARDSDWKPHKKKETKKTVRTKKTQENTTRFIPIPDYCLQRAELVLLHHSQLDAFGDEMECLRKNLPIKTGSKLKKIDVELDKHGIIRLRDRTRKMNMSSGNLAVLDGKHKIARLLIDRYHRKFCHANHATVVNELRQTYWILGLRNSVKKVLHECQWCRIRKEKPQLPPTGDLPAERLQHGAHPFTCTAVDYFGPMHVTIGRRREKRWGALFTCLTTRAIHLELVPSLSTSSMVMALRRMSARRGNPRVMYSDNGTNFIGADRELRDEMSRLKRSELAEAASHEGITWKFIPPGAPHMGGAWERMVRTVKTALSAILNERSPPEEVPHTLLTEVEHTVNSRPLTHLSASPEDEEALTPNHFLIGRSCGSSVVGSFDEHTLIGRADWKTSQRLADHFWRRWLRENLPTLMPRKISGREAPQPRRGDIVIIADASLPRNTWPRGEVVASYPGPDGRTRVADVRTSRGGVLRRPTSRLIVIVPATSRPQFGVHDGAYTGGETVSDA